MNELLDELFGRPDEQGVTLAALVMHNGEVIAERYGVQPENAFAPAQQVGPDTTLISWSMAKSVTHALTGLLVADGKIDLAAPAAVPAWQGTPKAAITLLDLLEMRPGLAFVEDYVDGDSSDCLTMLFGAGADDHAGYAAGLDMLHEPGTVWNYSSGTTNIICAILGDALGGGRATMDTYLAERLFGPCGMTSATAKFDAAGTFVGSSYVHATAADFARFGELYRRDGCTADGQRILPAGWAAQAIEPVAVDPFDRLGHDDPDVPPAFGYGRHWWFLPEYPGSLIARGYDGQLIVVLPDRGVTMVHLGKVPTEHFPLVVAQVCRVLNHI